MKYVWLIFPILLTGCFGPPAPQKVFGASGKTYTAPSICGALVQCKNAGEASCWYDTSTYIDAQGNKITTDVCKEVKK